MKRILWNFAAYLCSLVVALKLEEARNATSLDTWLVARRGAIRWDHAESNYLRRAQGRPPVTLSPFEQTLREKGMSADLARIAGRSL